MGAYFTFRFGGRWAEWDTASQADSIRAMVRDAVLFSPSGSYYSNGYLFSVVSTFLVAFTGLGVASLLQTLYPLVSASLVLVAWPLYYELTGSSRGATLATLFLFIQPDFLFVVLRGSHERLLRALLFVALWLLVRSLQRRDEPRSYASYVGLLYLSIYAIVATNALFGSSFVWAVTVALAGSWAATFLGPRLAAVSGAARHRLVYVPLLCAIMVFVFTTYVYPPAGLASGELSNTLDRLSRLFLTTSPDAEQKFNPYQVVVDSWVDFRIYLLISLGAYLLIGASFVVWVRNGLRWLAGAVEPPTLAEWLLWVFYGAFALQGGLAIVADRVGTFGGNLQYRTFPSFVMVAAPVVAAALVKGKPHRRLARFGAGALGVFALLGLMKATNEPAISNVWTFYLPAEVQAATFTIGHLHDETYWTDFDERLRSMQLLLGLTTVATATDALGTPAPSVRTFLITDLTRLRAARFGRPIPAVGGENRVYDNGKAQIYRTRAQTPYQS